MKEKIYFIPGLMTDFRLWKRVLPLIEENFEIIHVPIPRSTDFDEINEILYDVFKEEKINILGFSLGGYIASYFSIKFPHRVNRLFMVSSTPSSTSKEEIQRRSQKLEVFKSIPEFGLDKEKAISLVEEQNQNDEDLIQTIVDMFNDLGKEEFISQLTSTFNRVDLSKELKEVKFPITMFYSSDDRLLDFEALKELEEFNHNINLIKRVGTSHNIPLEFPKDFSVNIKKWMDN